MKSVCSVPVVIAMCSLAGCISDRPSAVSEGPAAVQLKLRESRREAAARTCTAEIRAWAADLAPDLEKHTDWDLVRRYLVWQAAPATTSDARRVLCNVARLYADWNETEAIRLLKVCIGDADAGTREAAVRALDRETWKGPAIDLLAPAVRDGTERVRTAAGSVLVARSDQRGVLPVIAGATSRDLVVRELCAQALGKLVVCDDGRPDRLRFKHSPEEIAGLVSLIPIEDHDTRGIVIRLLGMTGDKTVAVSLFKALPEQTIPRNRRRIAASLAQLRYQPVAGALVGLLKESETKLRSGEDGKFNHAWGIAESWAQLGDPESVSDMIGLLGEPEHARYAASALSWAFGLPGVDQDYTRGDPPGEVLVPVLNHGAHLERRQAANAPKGGELQKLWEGFWATNKDRYKWSDEESALRQIVRRAPPVWPEAPLPGTRTMGVALGKRNEWVEIPVTVQNQRCAVYGPAVDRSNGELYIIPSHVRPQGVSGGGRGVWKSTDHGATFEKTGENDSAGFTLCWGAMCVDPERAGRLAVFSMYGAAAMTLDGGASWHRFTSVSPATTDWGDVDWNDPQAMTVMQTNHERTPGMHISTDRGIVWQPVVPDRRFTTGLGVFDSNTVLHIETNKIERSGDLGRTWEVVSRENLRTLVLRKFKARGYLVSDKGLLVSADRGKTWVIQGVPAGDSTVCGGPWFGHDENHISVIARRNILETTDGGLTWKKIETPLAAKEFPSMGYDPAADILYVTGSGALYRLER